MNRPHVADAGGFPGPPFESRERGDGNCGEDPHNGHRENQLSQTQSAFFSPTHFPPTQGPGFVTSQSKPQRRSAGALPVNQEGHPIAVNDERSFVANLAEILIVSKEFLVNELNLPVGLTVGIPVRAARGPLSKGGFNAVVGKADEGNRTLAMEAHVGSLVSDLRNEIRVGPGLVVSEAAQGD
jgi:hypothetical protein